MNPEILFQDNDILIAVKPSGMPSQPDKTGDLDMLSYLESHCGQSLGLIHRLDRPVGGIMVFAKSKQAETNLNKQVQERTLEKAYLVVLCGKVIEQEGEMVDYLKKNARTNLSEAVPKSNPAGKRAVLRYNVLKELEWEGQTLSLTEIHLETGRHHQIRVQTSARGLPILGDVKYNKVFSSKKRMPIALWSYRLKGTHPITKKDWEFEKLPSSEPFSFFT